VCVCVCVCVYIHTHTQKFGSTGQSAVSDHPFRLLIRSQERLQYNVMIPIQKYALVCGLKHTSKGQERNKAQ